MTYRAVAEATDKAMAGPWFLLGFAVLVITLSLVSINASNFAISIITAAAVFMATGAQRRQSQATQGKLDELIACSERARNDWLHAEDRDEAEIQGLRR